MTTRINGSRKFDNLCKVRVRLSKKESKCGKKSFNPTLPGEGVDSAPLMFFFHHPQTPQAIKLALFDFKDTSLRHILQVIPVRCILRYYYGNKITKGTLQNLAQ